jgi:hypothetical protein
VSGSRRRRLLVDRDQGQLPEGAARAGEGVLDIHGRARRVGGRIAFVEAHARNGDGDLVGHATTSTLLRPRAGDIHNGRQRR